ncbi:MAG TPA: hypothetical protein PKA20_28185 [Burkholderiaceae bacterium]|nr:hypothetical protein [Burkholderiaceae bacterium]
MGRVIVFATPAFLVMIALEFVWGRRRGSDGYRLADTVNSLALGIMSPGLFALRPCPRRGPESRPPTDRPPTDQPPRACARPAPPRALFRPSLASTRSAKNHVRTQQTARGGCHITRQVRFCREIRHI